MAKESSSTSVAQNPPQVCNTAERRVANFNLYLRIVHPVWSTNADSQVRWSSGPLFTGMAIVFVYDLYIKNGQYARTRLVRSHFINSSVAW